MRWTTAGALLLVALGATAAQAQSDGDRTGFYAGAMGVFALENFHDLGEGIGSVGAKNDVGYSVRVGYRFHRHGAVELMAEHIPDFDLTAGGSEVASFDLWSATANLKWIFPVGPVEPYFVGGIGGMVCDSCPTAVDGDRDLVLRGGLGLQIPVVEHLTAVLEGAYVGPVEKLSEIPYGSLSAGILIEF